MSTQSSDSISAIEVSTLVGLLRTRALSYPNREAYVFLADGKTAEDSITYGELDRQARAIGSILQQQLPYGERILLLYQPGIEYIAAFMGCLYAGMIAVPTYPPRLNQPITRLQHLIADAQARAILTTPSILHHMERHFAHIPEMETLHWFTSTSIIASNSAASWQVPSIDRDTLAFLQYTSGSTSQPKGVMVSHGNLLANLQMIKQALKYTESSTTVSWLPLFHDMGLIANVLEPLYINARCILMPPVKFLQEPFLWLQAISRYRAHTSYGPNFAYNLCAHKITNEQKALLDLRSWQVALNGAEPVHYETLRHFATAFEPCGFRWQAFYPAYGLAEATVFVAVGAKEASPIMQTVDGTALKHGQVFLTCEESKNARTLVSSGQAWLDEKLIIVDPQNLLPCRSDQIGEIWVSGSHIAHGYWNRPDETQLTFGGYLADTGAGPFLRTGDLGFVRDGELYVTGRLKDLVIIRGSNHYPQDIELTVEQCCPSLRPSGGAAFSVEVDEEECLVITYEIQRQYRHQSIDDIARTIRQAVAEQHELQVYAIILVKPGHILKTSSGKIQRRACKAAFLANTLEVLGSSILDKAISTSTPMSLTQAALLTADPSTTRPSLVMSYLRERLRAILRVDVSWLSAEQPLNTRGMDSLMALELQHCLESDLGIAVSAPYLLQGPSISDLAEHILKELEHPTIVQRTALLPSLASSTGEYPLSHAQRAIWLAQYITTQRNLYNVASAIRIPMEIDIVQLRHAFQALLDRHPALRATFTRRDEDLIQHIHEHVPVDFQHIDAASWSTVALQQRLQELAQHPFDLEHGPLLRIYLFTRATNEHILSLTVHHIVADLWSMAIFMQELGILYQAPSINHSNILPPLPNTYTDYVSWQRDLLSGPEGETLRNYWHQQLAGKLPILALPTDKSRPAVQTYHGAAHNLTLDSMLTQQLKAFSQAHGMTLYMSLLAAFDVLLFRYTGQEEHLIGTLTTGRNLPSLASLIGYFVNPVVLRINLADNPTFAAFLKRVNQTALAAFKHQEYPFALLVEELQLSRDPSYSPLFQVMFVFEQVPISTEKELAAFTLNEPGIPLTLGELQVESLTLEQCTSQFDLMLIMAEQGDKLGTSLQYNTDLFDASTISRMLEHFQSILQAIVTNADQCIAHLPLLTEAEQHQQLIEWNTIQTTSTFYNTCIHHLFEAQVTRTPDTIALTYAEQHLTYSTLNRQANQLAHYLQQRGVKPEVRVAICMERSPELIVGLLAILKAGGAYIPLDPSYPQERLAFMLEDAQVSLLLTQQPLLKRLPTQTVPCLYLDAEQQQIEQMPVTNPVSHVTAQNLLYIMYTSGSTGKPKGAMNTHGGISNLIVRMQDTFPLTTSDSVLQKIPFSFDVSVWEIFWPLMCGARLVQAQLGRQDEGRYLIDMVIREHITILHFVPATLQVFLEAPGLEQCQSLRGVFCGGETLPVALQERFFSRLHATLYNGYGPTEAAICVTSWQCLPQSKYAVVPIGRPIANTQIYLLDTHMYPLPVGVPGEIYIGGIPLSRGYWNRSRETAERFLPNPFSQQPGARLYKTGDLARYRADGTLEFLGRLDQQVKLRGFRIELEEIEAVLETHPAVHESVVLMREDHPGNQRLVAYIIPQPTYTPSISELSQYLKERLPEYMVPSAFVLLPIFPLTPNGKIDRQVLPTPAYTRIDLDAAFAAPRDTTEQRLVHIFESILNVHPVGVRDNFFTLGGNSLLALRLTIHIQQQFGQDMPLSMLFQATTVEDIALLLHHSSISSSPQRYSPVVTIQPHGTKLPFFCVPPVGGNVLCYAELSRQMGANQPFYALQALGIEGEDQPYTDLAAMATFYREAIQTIQPAGPYTLGGWSIGGTIAFEIAQQLRKEGQEVALLALLDSSVPAATHRALPQDIDDTHLLTWFAQDLSDSVGKHLMILSEDLQKLEPEKWLPTVLEQAKKVHVISSETNIPSLRRLVEVFKANVQALTSYVPQASSCPTALLVTNETLALHTTDQTLGWGDLLGHALGVYTIPGNHYTMLAQPQVQQLAERLQRCIEEVQLGTPS